MKRTILIVLAVIMMLAMQMTAVAETNLSAYYEDGMLHVQWTPGSEGVLTVYRAGWPISVCSVSAGSDSSSVYVGNGEKLSVRLRNDQGCDTITVGAPQATEAPAATPQPTAEVTVAPTVEVTPVPTVDVTAAPTVEVTPAPTAQPTPKPTVQVTPAPTAVPTATPSPMVTVPVSSDGQSMTSMAAEVITQVNAERAQYGLSPLSMSAELTSAACIRAQEIVELFSHTRPDGSSWSTVSSAAFGENIAKGQRSADHVMAAWMSSEGHRENILRESFGSIGVCALKVDGVIYWVQLFGR